MLHESAGTSVPAPGPVADSARRHRGQLALLLQEILTVTVRLRGHRQVAADAASFREHITHVLYVADQEARALGYQGDDVQRAQFAVVALLDESVLGSGQSIFAEWEGRPLQVDLFGNNRAGEYFFDHLRQLLERADSAALGDVLEVFYLCLLLGFQGRYSVGGRAGELHAFTQRTGEKIARIRGMHGELSPAWRPPEGELAGPQRDPWVRRLTLVAAAAAVLTIALFVVYRIWLSADLNELRQLTALRR